MNFLKTDSMQKMQYALDGMMKRNEAIANNIANVNTPGYKREYVDFESVLQNKTEMVLDTVKTHKNHMTLQSSDALQIQKEKEYHTRRDENNINIDRENTDVAINQIMYGAVTRQLSNQLNRIKTVIRDGR